MCSFRLPKDFFDRSPRKHPQQIYQHLPPPYNDRATFLPTPATSISHFAEANEQRATYKTHTFGSPKSHLRIKSSLNLMSFATRSRPVACTRFRRHPFDP